MTDTIPCTWTRPAGDAIVRPMSPGSRYIATVLGLAGIAVCVFFLTRSVPIVVDWVAWLFGDTPAKPRLEGLAMFVGIASTLGTVVLLVGIGLILWIFKQMWRPGRGPDAPS